MKAAMDTQPNPMRSEMTVAQMLDFVSLFLLDYDGALQEFARTDFQNDKRLSADLSKAIAAATAVALRSLHLAIVLEPGGADEKSGSVRPPLLFELRRSHGLTACDDTALLCFVCDVLSRFGKRLCSHIQYDPNIAPKVRITIAMGIVRLVLEAGPCLKSVGDTSASGNGAIFPEISHANSLRN